MARRARRYRMTAKRRAALRKAQRTSARARKHLKKPHKKLAPLTNGQVYAVRSVSAVLGGTMGVLAVQGYRQSAMVNRVVKSANKTNYGMRF